MTPEPPVVTIDQAQMRRPVRLIGQVTALTLAGADTGATIRLRLTDATGSVHLIWLGQRRIAGLEPGRGLAVEGRISMIDGQPSMINPRYQLLPEGPAQ